MSSLRMSLLAGAFAAAASFGVAHADSIVFNAGGGDTASPLSFSVGGGTGALSGYEYTPVIGGYAYSGMDLYQKNAGANEMGIGINGDFDNEISNSRANGTSGPYGVVVIDLGASGSALRNYAAAGTLGLSFNSVTGADAGGVWYSTSAPTPGFLGVLTGVDLAGTTANLDISTAQDNGANPLFVDTTDEFLYISTDINHADQYSILLHDIETPASVPEPAALGLLGLGLIGLGIARRR